MKKHFCLYWLRKPLFSPLMAAFLLVFFGCNRSRSELAALREHVEALTGAHTRIVWVQDTQERTDVFARGDQLRLMGFDSRDGRGERVILAGPDNFAKPLFVADGNTIVFSNYLDGHVYRVDWEGTEVVRLVKGRALDVWRDQRGVDWVFVGTEPASGGAPSYHRVTRHRIDDPAISEHVWKGQPVGEDSFQLSADGRVAAGNFPWPECGIMHIPEQRIEILGRGCWTSLAPDHSYRFWIFDGSHRNLLMFDTVTGDRATISLSQAPGIGGHEAYHPRWSNHPRIMSMTGPYKIRHGGNNIRGGGEDVEIHVGRFAEDFRSIEAWAQVTSNPYANFFPDVWVETGDDVVLRGGDVSERADRVVMEGWPSSQEGLLYLWEHGAAQNQVVDSATGARQIYRPEARALARLGLHHSMWVDAGYFVDSAFPELGEAFSLEASVHARERDGILVAVGDTFSLAVKNERWVAHVDTRIFDLGEVSDTSFIHIVLCVSPSMLAVYQNGARLNAIELDEPLRMPQKGNLYWGGHPEKGYGGLGRLSHLAWYGRALTGEEVERHAAYLGAKSASRASPVVENVRGVVKVGSSIPTPEDIAPYTRALIFQEYEVVEGEREGERLLAAHWGILGGSVLADAERPVGSEHDLQLVLFDDHPELEGERVVMDHENLLLDWYYDLTL